MPTEPRLIQARGIPPVSTTQKCPRWPTVQPLFSNVLGKITQMAPETSDFVSSSGWSSQPIPHHLTIPHPSTNKTLPTQTQVLPSSPSKDTPIPAPSFFYLHMSRHHQTGPGLAKLGGPSYLDLSHPEPSPLTQKPDWSRVLGLYVPFSTPSELPSFL